MIEAYDLRSPRDNVELGIEHPRLRAYEAGELTLGEIALLAQDIYEAGVLVRLPARYYLMHHHLARNGLIHLDGRPGH